jgi:DNA-binding transcriptional LysR family regulator
MIVPLGHERAGATAVTPEELASEVMIARRSCELLRETSRFFTRRGVRPMFSLRSENDDLCIRMVAAGLGITTAPVSFLIEGTTTIPVTGYAFDRSVGLIADASRLDEPGFVVTFGRVAEHLVAALPGNGSSG